VQEQLLRAPVVLEQANTYAKTFFFKKNTGANPLLHDATIWGSVAN
jgi:hypothetical protein